jgi:ATP-binding cassette subfamily G (WHITE) protein 2 (SNQ2)
MFCFSCFCAVHQPSAELFSHFDRLLLLKSGGREVFFGDLGEDGLNVAEYFTSAKLEPGFEQPDLPEKVNIASWMLDVIGAGTVSSHAAAFHSFGRVADSMPRTPC